MTLRFIEWSEFQEKEYEHSANSELQRRSRPQVVFPSNQVNEEVLGYDAVADPTAKNEIWTLLRLTRPPGVRLKPTHWPKSADVDARALPNRVCSLVVQYKRAQVVSSATRSPQRTLWPGQDYYRIHVSRRQHNILEKLEKNLLPDAYVRYFAPSFHTYADLRAAETGRTVLSKSTLVAPCAPDGAVHRYWTYSLPGVGGKWNADGVDAFSETFEGFVENENYVGQPLSTHMASLARGLVASQLLDSNVLSNWVDDVDRALTGFRDFATDQEIPYLPQLDRPPRRPARRSETRFQFISEEPAGLSVVMDVLVASLAEQAFRRRNLKWFLVERN